MRGIRQLLSGARIFDRSLLCGGLLAGEGHCGARARNGSDEDRRRNAGFCNEVTILEPHPPGVDIIPILRRDLWLPGVVVSTRPWLLGLAQPRFASYPSVLAERLVRHGIVGESYDHILNRRQFR